MIHVCEGNLKIRYCHMVAHADQDHAEVYYLEDHAGTARAIFTRWLQLGKRLQQFHAVLTRRHTAATTPKAAAA